MKQKNAIIVFLSVVIVILLALLMITKNLDTKCADVTTNDKSSSTTDMDNNNQTNVGDTTDNKTEFSNYMLDKSKVKTNYDNTYGTVKLFVDDGIQYRYSAHLSIDGTVKVSATNKNDGSDTQHKLDNISNVVDLVSFNDSANTYIYYMLLQNGDVYSYDMNSYHKNNYDAVKVTEVTNVKRIFRYDYECKKMAGCWQVIAVTKDNEYLVLNNGTI